MTKYIGNELELFSKAYNWKAYFGSLLRPYLKGRVLEVGAGMGGTTAFLSDWTQDLWTCLEPDCNLASQIESLIINKDIPSYCNVSMGSIHNISWKHRHDSIIYIDVLEHIERDEYELISVAQHLSKGSMLIILVPAHRWLYSSFDKAIGHYRRYNKKMLRDIIPSSFKETKLFYLDSVGLLASIVNKFLLKQRYPSESQIRFWDNRLVKASKYVDPIFSYSLGRSLIGIWEKQ